MSSMNATAEPDPPSIIPTKPIATTNFQEPRMIPPRSTGTTAPRSLRRPDSTERYFKLLRRCNKTRGPGEPPHRSDRIGESDWKKDINDPVRRDIGSKKGLEALFGRLGISNDQRIVLYGDFNNWFAAFAFWVFKYYGVDDVVLLNGGRT